jgi:hypothetical protein
VVQTAGSPGFWPHNAEVVDARRRPDSVGQRSTPAIKAAWAGPEFAGPADLWRAALCAGTTRQLTAE